MLTRLVTALLVGLLVFVVANLFIEAGIATVIALVAGVLVYLNGDTL